MSGNIGLLPCPFCGGEAEFDQIPAGVVPQCTCCGVEIRLGSIGVGWYETCELAAADWNRRAAEQPAGTTSDKYRAELYDEVWERARGMGYGNVTNALVELERMKQGDQPDTVKVRRELLERIHRDLDACQKVIWLAGCRPRGYGFDPAYVTEAQERLKEIDALLAGGKKA